MEIRICQNSEIDKVRKIWDYCFDDGIDYTNFYFEKKFKPENAVVLEKDGDIISAIHLNQHKINLLGRIEDVSYVVGVSTLPEARGLGKMGELMEYSFKEMYKRDQDVSLLMPIDFRLYSKFGYANVYDMLKAKIDIFSLGKFKIMGDFQLASEENVEDLINIYEESQKDKNGYAIRDRQYFLEFIEEMKIEGGHIYINYIDGQPVSYLAYSISNRNFEIREIYYKNINSYKSILKFIFNHNTQCEYLILNAAIDDPARHILENPKDHNFEIKPFMMARIINLQSLLSKLEVNNWCERELVVKINDQYLEENAGVYRFLRTENGVLQNTIISNFLAADSMNWDGLMVEKLGEDSDFDLEIEIGQLTTIIFSYYSPEEFAMVFDKDLDKVRVLYEILSIEKANNHINEYV